MWVYSQKQKDRLIRLSDIASKPRRWQLLSDSEKLELELEAERLTEENGHPLIMFQDGTFATSNLFLEAAKVILNLAEGIEPVNQPQQPDQPEQPQKLIQIAPSAIPSLFECLKEYFAQEEYPKLEALLNGQPIEGKVHFLKNQNQLADVFFRLKEKNLLFNTIEEASVWLATFYKYKTKRTFEDCKQSSIADVFSKEIKRPKEHNAICTKIGQ